MRVPFGAGETRREGFQIGSIGSDRSLQDFSTQREPEQNVPAPSVYILFIRGAYMRQYAHDARRGRRENLRKMLYI